MRRDFIRDLPIELSTRILSYLPLTDITQSVSLVSRQWWSVTRSRSLWHSLFMRQGWKIDMDRFLPPLTNIPANCTALAHHESAPPIAPVDWLDMYKRQHLLQSNWAHGDCRTIRWPNAHTESIYCLQFDRHNRLFTGSRDHTVKVWYLADNGEITPLATLCAHTGSVLTLQVDGDTLITGSSDATICVWDLKTQTVLHTLRHSDSVLSLRFNDKWLVTSSKDRTVRVWERGSAYASSFELRGHRVAINAVQLVDDILVSASGDRTIKVWDLGTRSCILTLSDHTRGVACLDFDGKYITSGSSDRSIRIWNIETGQCERTIINAHTDLVRTIMFNREMGVIVSGSYDESIKVWSFESGELLHRIKTAHTSRVFKLMFDRSRIVSCSHDKAVTVTDFGANVPNARLFC
ncbi:WD40 repeat-like protein [Linderina pennispora]|uniref:WD40 repeat-like protein n=1 Tax=Linderina pennispora TaxID=61395 RepID=A0A1Y1VZ41_9FUNG|nr:WD40 repeat-like protein [Linderina pennispora]ORX66537.1 WD40 repeat-like protein [Linderina pennispora]